MSSVFNSDDESFSPGEDWNSSKRIKGGKKEKTVKIDVRCPSHLNSFIIGVKGSKIKPIRQEFSEVCIDIGDKLDCIQVKGPASKVELVKNKLETMISEGHKKKYKICNIDISKDLIRYLLEKNGYQIERLRQETGIAIIIEENSGVSALKMEGNEDGLEKARKAITGIMEYLDLGRDHVTEEIIIERRYHGALLGHQAITLKETLNKFKGVHITFPEKDDISDTIKIQGPKKMVNQCHLYLLQLVEIRKKSKHQQTQIKNDSCGGILLDGQNDDISSSANILKRKKESLTMNIKLYIYLIVESVLSQRWIQDSEQGFERPKYSKPISWLISRALNFCKPEVPIFIGYGYLHISTLVPFYWG